MIRISRKSSKNVLILLAFVLALIAFSAFHAYRISDQYIRDTTPPPLYSIRFALHPNRYVEDAPELGFKPGWVVIYAPRSKTYGTAFYVSLLGKMLASGTPSIVTQQHQQAQNGIEQFNRAFAHLDAEVQVGMTFSNAATILRIEPAMLTNDDGTIDAYYTFMPRALEYTKVDWLTNGITLHVSNNIVIGKGYAYTSSH